MKRFQNYITIFQTSILKNTIIFQLPKQKTLGSKYNPLNLFLQNYCCDAWYENEKPADTTTKGDKEESANLSSMPPLVDIAFIPSLEGDNEKKEEKD